MNRPKLTIKRLTPEHQMLPFDCGDKDLNEFLLTDSYLYQKELIAVTYLAESDKETILYFSLSNDKLSAIEVSKNAWRRIKGSVPHEKHRRDYPAVKIGRLGVNVNHRGHGENYGSMIMEYIKNWMTCGNKTGCRFITVDAYKEAVTFYLRNDFLFLGREEEERYTADKDNPKSEGTYAMYFDLSTVLKQENPNIEQ